MSLSELFNDQENGKLIYRGDCRERGYLGTSIFEEGKRFEIIFPGGSYTFVAEKVRVMPIGNMTEKDFENDLNGGGVIPLFPSDIGPINNPAELCTIVEFKFETGVPIPECWALQHEAKPS